MSADLLERLKWVLIENHRKDSGFLAEIIIKEIETTHRIVDPDHITEEMLDACFGALPEHYDPPDLTRRLWHAFKAKRRYSAMVKAVRKIIADK